MLLRNNVNLPPYLALFYNFLFLEQTTRSGDQSYASSDIPSNHYFTCVARRVK